ncbi:GlxA family transcriptional regulator [Chitinophaga sp. 22321]|uniref:Helix-turn-helix domain-containing protein n=1 Tax=Chitinophaga hostae TaxID=2831022 RepID=A0ABS5J228_9BACT|nr:helix-turn-helix domain-containing protein [Chitinophaga hostae]MBS0029255.1 helix-turn-helix domain-containing protein [Chitinophaga hostae]
MKHISILALNDATMTSIDGSLQLFSRINDFLKYSGKAAFYTIEIVGLTAHTSLNGALYTINVDKKISEVKKTDLIVIPIICGDFPKTLKSNEGFCDWVRAQYQEGAELASLCVGSFFLASTGLLNGRKCATHWAAKNEFEMMFPAVNLMEDAIITDENGIYTSGGTYSYLNLLLYIIEKHVGREMSVLASKMFEIDIGRKSQHQFLIFMGQKKHDDTAVLKAQQFLEENPDKRFTIDEISSKFGVGRRTFERRFKKSTGNSLIEYMQRVKVEAIKKQLELGTKTVNEIIFEIGYNDINAFRRVFRKYTGMSLVDYRKKYSQAAQSQS